MMRFTQLIVLLSFIMVSAAGTAHSGDIKKGEALFNDSSLGTNGKSCNTCHAGGKNIDAGKKTYTILGSNMDSIEDAVNFCIKMALSGKPVGKDSVEMTNMVSYLRTLKGKKQMRSVAPGY